MKFSLDQDFPADPARLWAALGRRDYVEQKYRSLGAATLRILRFEVTRDSIDVELERSAPVARKVLPAWARPFVADRQVMRHHTRWRRADFTRIDAELDIWPVGLPVHAHGVGTLTGRSPGRTSMTLHFEVKCRLPAVGNTAARLFADQVKEALQADHAFTLDYLAADASPLQLPR